MKPLRERMMEDLQLKGYSQSTQILYVSAVRQLCEHFNKPPGRITEENLRDYFLYGKNVKKWSRSTSTVALCGIKFFFDTHHQTSLAHFIVYSSRTQQNSACCPQSE